MSCQIVRPKRLRTYLVCAALLFSDIFSHVPAGWILQLHLERRSDKCFSRPDGRPSRHPTNNIKVLKKWVRKTRASNNLPDAIRHSPSLETFKRSLKSHLFLQCFLPSLSSLVFIWQLWLCTAPLKWPCVIYGTLQIYYFTLHYVTFTRRNFVEGNYKVPPLFQHWFSMTFPWPKNENPWPIGTTYNSK